MLPSKASDHAPLFCIEIRAVFIGGPSGIGVAGTPKCPRCGAPVTGAADDLGFLSCGGCGARLRKAPTVKVTIQSPTQTSTAAPVPAGLVAGAMILTARVVTAREPRTPRRDLTIRLPTCLLSVRHAALTITRPGTLSRADPPSPAPPFRPGLLRATPLPCSALDTPGIRPSSKPSLCGLSRPPHPPSILPHEPARSSPLAPRRRRSCTPCTG